MNNDQAEFKPEETATTNPGESKSSESSESSSDSEKGEITSELISHTETINEANKSDVKTSRKSNESEYDPEKDWVSFSEEDDKREDAKKINKYKASKSDESSEQHSNNQVIVELDSSTPLLKKEAPQNEYLTFLDIFGQSLEVMPALPLAALAGHLVPGAAELTGNTVASQIIAGATIPASIATAAFTLVGTAVYLLKGFEKSEESDFNDYIAKNIASLPAFMSKLYVAGGGAFSLYVLCGELSKLYVLPRFSIGLAAGGLVTGLPATVLGIAAFVLFNKVLKLGMPPEKIVGIASIFLGLTLGNFTVEYCHSALTYLLGKAGADSSPYWLPTLVTMGVASTGNTIGHLMQMRGMFACEEIKAIEVNPNDVRIDINNDINNHVDINNGESKEIKVLEDNISVSHNDTIIDFDAGTVCCGLFRR